MAGKRKKETGTGADHLAAIVEAATDMVATANPEGRVLYINSAGREMLGLPEGGDVTGMTISDAHPAWAKDIVISTGIPKAIREGVWRGETALLLRNGCEIPVSQVIISHRDREGAVEFLSTIVRDISAQKAAEKILSESENLYRAIFEYTGAATALIEEDSTVSMVNREFEIITGWSREEVERRKKWTEFVSPEDIGRMSEYHKKRRLDPKSAPEKYEFTLIGRGGARKSIYLTVGLIPGTKKSLASLIDVTELKQAREKIRRQFDEIQGQYEELEALNEALTQAHNELLDTHSRLHESESRFRSLVQTIPHGVIEIGLDGLITFANSTQAKMHGYTEEEIAGRFVWDFIENDDARALFIKLFRRAVRDRSVPRQMSMKSAGKHGRSIDVQVDWDYRRSGDGKPVSIVAVLTDITVVKKAEESLRASEEKFSRAFHESPAMMMLTDAASGVIVDINESFLRLAEFTRDEVIGRTTIEMNIWKNEEERNGFVAKIVEQGFIRNSVYEYITKNGKTVTGLFSAEFITVDARKLLLLVGVDITDRVRAEEELKISERKFYRVFNSSPEAIGISRMSDATYIEVNRSALIMGEFTREEVIGKTPAELGIFAKYEQYLRLLRELRKNSSVENLEFSFRTKTGKIKTGLLSAERIDFGGEPCIITSVLDISDRKKAEQELEAERERLAITLRSIGDGVITTDIQGRVQILNKVAEDLTGCTQEQAFNRPLSEVFVIVDGRNRKPCDDPVAKVLQYGATTVLESNTLLISRDGSERVIADSGAPIRDHEGAILGVIIVFRDITEKKQIEEGLIKAQRLESLGVMAGGIAHDFNNILTAILGNINLARLQARGDGRILDLLADAEKSSLRARELTQQLLTFARGGKPVKKIGSIENLLRETATFTLRGSNILCEFDIAPDLRLLEFDEGQMGQVVNNLVINARQAMPKGGILRIGARNLADDEERPPELRPVKYILITVADEGIGIPDYALHNIFDPYFTTKENGTGLGLTTTYSIIVNHEGHIDVRSQLDKGTVFTIYLPASETPGVVHETTGGQIRKGKGKLLFLDDEEIVLNVTRKMLASLGYTTVCVNNGEEAVAAYKAAMAEGAPFDAVMLDLTIPGGMGGREVMGILQGIDPKVKAVVSSGYSNDPVMADFRSYGFSGVALKPYRMEDLSELLFSLLGQYEITN